MAGRGGEAAGGGGWGCGVSVGLFHVIVRDDKTRTDTLLTRYACPHGEAVTILGKQSDRARYGGPAHRRLMVCPVAEVRL